MSVQYVYKYNIELNWLQTINIRMRLQGRFNSDFSPYFDRGGNRVVLPNNVKLVIGTKTFNCSG